MAVSSKAISLLSRLDLEERFIEISEENQLLKKHAKAQEEKMKKLATKLLKLTSDERREWSLKRKLDKKSTGRSSRTDELEDMVYELQDKVRELEKQKANLMGRVTILRQQLDSKGKRHTLYDKVPPKVNCGLLRTKKKSFSTEDIPSMKGQNVSVTQGSPGPRYGRSLLEDARKDNQELEDLVVVLKREVGVLQEEIEHKKEQIKLSDLKHEEEVLRLKQQMQLVKNNSQKVNLEEDVEKIRLQRELRLKTVSIQSMETQYNTLEKNFLAMKNSRSELMDEVKLLNTQLTQERVHSSDLSNQLHSAKMESQNITELHHAVSDLKVERDILKLSNDRLMKSALNAPAMMQSSISHPPLPSSFQITNKLLEERLKQAEAKLNRETENHRNIVLQLQAEIKSKEGVEQRFNQLQLEKDQLESEYQSMKDRLTQYCQGSSIDWKIIEDAIAQYKLTPSIAVKEPTESTPPCTGRCLKEIQELKLALSEKTNELNKLDRLLSLQNTISQDYQKENEALRNEMKQSIEEYDKKLEEQSQLISIKTTRIKKLESELKNIKYSPQKSKNEKPQSSTTISEGVNDSLIELSPGQNLLQVHIDHLNLSSDSIRCFQPSSPPSLFVCLLLTGYKTQVTPVECSFNPSFQFTANYVINMDDGFLEQLNTGSICVELHQAFGMKYEILGRATLPLKPLLSTDEDDTYHERISMKGAGKLSSTSQAAFFNYWMKLKLPLATREQSVAIPDPPLHTGSGVYDNEIVITIIKCINLPVSSQGSVPSSYAVYQFYTFPDHDTPVQQSTISPEFNDTRIYRVVEDQQIMQYLKQQDLMMFIFDDDDPDDSNYVGVAKVPLFRLANGEKIKGTYPLYSSSDAISGHISLSIVWSHPMKSKYHHQGDHPLSPLHVNTSSTRKETHLLVTSTAPSIPQSNDKTKSSIEHKKPNSESPSPQVSPVLTVSDLTPSTDEERADEVSRTENEKVIHENQNRSNQQNKEESKIEAAIEDDDLYKSLTLSEDISEQLSQDEELTGVTDEDTLFEETNVSGTMFQSQPSVKILDEGDDESTIIGGSLDLSLDERRSPSPIIASDQSSPHSKALSPPHSPSLPHRSPKNRKITKTTQQDSKNDDFEVRFSITVLSFTLEEGVDGLQSLQISNAQVFIEYQLLDIDESELETPTSLPLPQPGQTAVFNFTKEFIIKNKTSPTTVQLLKAMVNSEVPVERRIPFTVVSDPQDNDSETECQEIGVAELDIIEVINDGRDQAVEDIDVYSVDTGADNGVIGYLTVSLDGLDELRKLIVDNK